jgi:hypothetical protein
MVRGLAFLAVLIATPFVVNAAGNVGDPGALDQQKAEIQRLCKDGCTVIPNKVFEQMMQALKDCASLPVPKAH